LLRLRWRRGSERERIGYPLDHHPRSRLVGSAINTSEEYLIQATPSYPPRGRPQSLDLHLLVAPSEKLGVFCKRLRTIAYSPCRSDHPLSPFPGIRNGSIRRPFTQIHPLRLVPPRLTRSATIHVTSRQRCLMGNGYNGETTEIM